MIWPKKRKKEEKLQLKSGYYYAARDGYIWCCYKVDTMAPTQAQAKCVRIIDDRLEYFYLDGRYDCYGKREHTLIKELELKDVWMNETYEAKWHVDLPHTDHIAREHGLRG